MNNIPELNLEDYYYELPDEKIAKFPLEKRDESKLLIINKKNKNISEDIFKNIENIIDDSYHIVYNNTKVIPARFFMSRENGKIVEVFCLNSISPSNDPQISLLSKKEVVWNCLIRGRKIKVGETLKNNFGSVESLKGEIISKGESFHIKFTWEESISFFELLQQLGNIPLPPYIHRELEESDKERYQTIFAKYDGSVAAPTAALHFTDDLINKLKARNVNFSELVLHVGAGTFKPLSSDKIEEHTMHQEYFSVSLETIEEIYQAKKENKKILAVGTTSVRTLESLIIFAEKILNSYEGNVFISQWEVYNQKETDGILLLETLIKYMKKHNLKVLSGETQLIIIPDYKFRIVDAIITNFHQPKSTLILLVAAFIGKELWESAYNFALNNDFRFLSYGDSSIII